MTVLLLFLMLFLTLLTHQSPQPNRHGDSAMCMRFWCESSARRGGLLAKLKKARTKAAIFFFSNNDCYRARFTPKPGHISLSPHRTGCLVCFVALLKTKHVVYHDCSGFQCFVFCAFLKRIQIPENLVWMRLPGGF
jgi:hypothetical protein